MAPGPGDRSGGPGYPYPYVISTPPGCRRQGILGTAVRDYIHVDDLAAAQILALASLEQGSTTAAYNLGSGRGYSVLEVIKAAEKVTGQKVPYRGGPPRPGDPAVLVASAEKAMAELGWRPRYTELEDIIATAWQWHRRRPRGYSQGIIFSRMSRGR
ncbi:GDP-mannose 4,6-dehydratase [Neomoorella humiferrea]|uniref:GDP-mannose 4,6-dehydratase n=1 Tax=Neomoorella humiferrea TaxID=676965 RepID=UPI0011B28B59